MKRETLAKVVALILLVIVLVNFIAFIFVRNPPWLFLTIIVVIALMAYFVVPRIRKGK